MLLAALTMGVAAQTENPRGIYKMTLLTGKVGNKSYQIKWLSKNRIAIEDRIDYRIDWMILERMTDGTTPLQHIASRYTPKRKR